MFDLKGADEGTSSSEINTKNENVEIEPRNVLFKKIFSDLEENEISVLLSK